MAARYWVGGTASWDATAGTKWATTSGGAGGAAVPTSSDDVFFDAASGAVIVTIAASYPATCKTFTCTGFTGTLVGGASSNLVCYGNAVFVAGMTVTSLSIGFAATASFTGAGKTFGNVSLGHPGSAYTLTMVDALNAITFTCVHSNTLLLKSGTVSSITSIIDETTSAGNFTLGATTTSAATLSVASGSVNIRYATISYSTATGGATFTAGPGATDGGNNTGWTFLSSGTPLFELGAF